MADTKPQRRHLTTTTYATAGYYTEDPKDPKYYSSPSYYTEAPTYYTNEAPEYYTTKTPKYYTTTYAAPTYYTTKALEYPKQNKIYIWSDHSYANAVDRHKVFDNDNA